jgi:hypothetical protein
MNRIANIHARPVTAVALIRGCLNLLGYQRNIRGLGKLISNYVVYLLIAGLIWVILENQMFLYA